MLLLSTLANYWPVAGFQFINYDDLDYVVENPQLHPGLTWKGISWALTTGYQGNWHPLTWISHMLDCQIYGLNPGGHHVTNLLFHLANTLLLFFVLKRMTGAHWRSAFVAALFALHPLHVESVAWVSERKDVLSAFFFLLTLWAYGRYAEQSTVHSPRSTVRGPQSMLETEQAPGTTQPASIVNRKSQIRISALWYGLALLFFALGLMSKPMLVTLPFVLLLLDFWPLGRLQFAANAGASPVQGSRFKVQGSRFPLPLLLEKLPFFALTIASSVITFIVQQRGGAMVEAASLSPEYRIQNAVIAYLSYLRKTIWPTDLAVFYPLPSAYASGATFLAVVILLLVSAAVFILAKRFPYLPVGWFWFLGTLVPVIGIVQVGNQSMADRYSYIPLIGVFLMLAWGASDLVSGRPYGRVALTLAGSGVLGLCATLTWAQVRCWQNNETLFRHAIAVTSGNYIAHHNLGAHLAQHGKIEEAASHFAEAIRIRPTYAESQSDLGLALVLLGKVDEGIEHYRTAIAACSTLGKPHYNLGLALAKKGNREEAAAEYQEAVRLSPESVDARSVLAGTLADLGRYDEALVQYNELLRFKPNDPSIHSDLATLFKLQGNQTEAVRHLAEAIRLKPDDAEAHENLGVLLAQQGQVAEAINHFTEALRLRPAALTHYYLGLAFVVQGDRKAAVEHYRMALQMAPELPLALNDLAWMLATAPEAELRNGPEAVRLAEQAAKLTGGREARFLGTLDAAYAEAGRFADAIRTGEQARDLALAAGQKDLAGEAEKRLASYRAGKPFRQ